VNVILQVYALLFLLAIPARRLPDRWLLRVAGAALVFAPLGFLLGRGADPGAFLRRSASLVDPAGEILHSLVVSGPYPLITWTAPFLFGLWLGRRDLACRSTQRRLVVVGGVTALVVLVSARALVRLLGAPRTPGDLRFLVTSGAHSQMPLWLLGGTAAAVFVLGISLQVGARWPQMTWPLQAVGQLALTAYVVHLVVLQIPRTPIRSEDLLGGVAWVTAFAVALTLASVLWRHRFRGGPLELLLRPAWLVSAGRAAATEDDRAVGDVVR